MTAPLPTASATPACATVSEAEVEAACLEAFGGPVTPDHVIYDRMRRALEAAARVRAAPVQGAEPVALIEKAMGDHFKTVVVGSSGKPFDETGVSFPAQSFRGYAEAVANVLAAPPPDATLDEARTLAESFKNRADDAGRLSRLVLAAPPPDAQRAKIEAARREERERCAKTVAGLCRLAQTTSERELILILEREIRALGDRP